LDGTQKLVLFKIVENHFQNLGSHCEVIRHRICEFGSQHFCQNYRFL